MVLASVTAHLVGRDEPELPTAAPSSPASSTKTRATTPAPPVAPGNDDGEPSAQATAGAPDGVPQDGTGTIRVVAVPAASNDVAGRTVRYTVETRTVQSVLLDPRGWQKVDGIRFVNVTPAQAAGRSATTATAATSPGTGCTR
ncbi:hypothetical protein ACFUC1_17420 [Pedococcus sp. NPDC057267]|uniref:hypothetical protein n=1 Tax=Pedococcus sp. NPDC057267 TaxID=3346077 RepID=UPI0036412BAD